VAVTVVTEIQIHLLEMEIQEVQAEVLRQVLLVVTDNIILADQVGVEILHQFLHLKVIMAVQVILTLVLQVLLLFIKM
tara:strand:- start:80 stop:313 length:234 start_codon:yes stop_codon:yes gene_type:complete